LPQATGNDKRGPDGRRGCGNHDVPRLCEWIDQPGKTLSGGEQQMLAITRVMMAEAVKQVARVALSVCDRATSWRRREKLGI